MILKEKNGRLDQEVAQSEDKRITVRIAAELITSLDDLVKNATDEFGLPLFKSRPEAVIQALKEFFRTRNFSREI